jgi:hypothetical protein
VIVSWRRNLGPCGHKTRACPPRKNNRKVVTRRRTHPAAHQLPLVERTQAPWHGMKKPAFTAVRPISTNTLEQTAGDMAAEQGMRAQQLRTMRGRLWGVQRDLMALADMVQDLRDSLAAVAREVGDGADA